MATKKRNEVSLSSTGTLLQLAANQASPAMLDLSGTRLLKLAQKHDREAEDVAIALHRLSPKARSLLRAKLPDLIAPILRSVQVAAELTNEPVGAPGHLAAARAYLSNILDAAAIAAGGKP